MTSPMEAIIHYLQANELRFWKSDEDNLVFFDFPTTYGTVLGSLRLRRDQEGLGCRIIVPLCIIPTRRAVTAEFINLVNAELAWGQFQLDLNDGELIFFLAMECTDHTTIEAYLNSALKTANEALKVYFLRIVDVVVCGISVEIVWTKLQAVVPSRKKPSSTFRTLPTPPLPTKPKRRPSSKPKPPPPEKPDSDSEPRAE